MPPEPDPATVYTNLWLKDQTMSFHGKGYVLGEDQRKDSMALPSWIELTFPWRLPSAENEGGGQKMVSFQRAPRNISVPSLYFYEAHLAPRL